MFGAFSSKISFLFIILSLFRIGLGEYISCRAADGKSGVCIPQMSCGIFMEWIRNSGTYNRLPGYQKKYMKNSRCRIKGLTCCPSGEEILKRTKCKGSLRKYVSYGENAEVFQFPFMALLKYQTANGLLNLCGGSLITNRYVLTAGHCIPDPDFPRKLVGVVLGELDLSRDVDCLSYDPPEICAPPVESYGIEHSLRHPDYNWAYLKNDIGLIKLDRKVQYADHIEPICLPVFGTQPLRLNTLQIIAGWGTTENGVTSDILQYGVMELKHNRDCVNLKNLLEEQHLCISGKNAESSCKGDSGGPLFKVEASNDLFKYIQHGIISAGGSRCDGSSASVATNVTAFLPWIYENIVY